MGRKPKKNKGNINNLFLICNVGSQNNAIFCRVCMKKKGRKELVPGRGKHNMDVMTSVTSKKAFFFEGGGEAGGGGRVTPLFFELQARNSEELLGCFFSCK